MTIIEKTNRVAFLKKNRDVILYTLRQFANDRGEPSPRIEYTIRGVMYLDSDGQFPVPLKELEISDTQFTAFLSSTLNAKLKDIDKELETLIK